MQTTYSEAMPIGIEGQRADMGLEHRVESFLAEGSLSFGLLLQAGTDPEKQVKAMAALPAFDIDSIVETPVASAAAPQTIEGAALDGVIGGDAIVPAQIVSFTLNNSADWDDTTGIVKYEDAEGQPQIEQIAIPNGGNTTLYTLRPVRKFESFYVPTQSGVGGSLTIGTYGSSGDIILSRKDFPGVLMYDPGDEPGSSTVDVADEHQANVLVSGTIVVKVEEAVTKGDAAWVRVVEVGTDYRGQFRGTPIANFARLEGAHFLTSALADGLAVLRIR